MLAFSVFHGIGPTILAERWTLVSYQHRPNVALQPIANVHYNIGPTYTQCQCFGWDVVSQVQCGDCKYIV